MADICTVVSSYVTLMMCVTAPVCSTEPVDGKIFCAPQALGATASGVTLLNLNRAPVESCNRTIVNYRCTRPDGTAYDYTN